MSEAKLRLRRAFIAPGDDGPGDSSLPGEVLDHSAFLNVLVSLSRQIYVLRTTNPLSLPLDALPVLPTLLVAVLAYLADSLADEKRLLWTLAPVGAQVIALLLDWEARRVVVDAEGLRGLMYDAPEA
ncbi:hypothetical protein JCM10295v2_005131 [Rhodotorula toruloides]